MEDKRPLSVAGLQRGCRRCQDTFSFLRGDTGHAHKTEVLGCVCVWCGERMNTNHTENQRGHELSVSFCQINSVTEDILTCSFKLLDQVLRVGTVELLHPE